MTFGHEEPRGWLYWRAWMPSASSSMERGNIRLKKLLAEKGAGPIDSPGGGGGKFMSLARARHRPLHWRQLPARWTDVEHTWLRKKSIRR